MKTTRIIVTIMLFAVTSSIYAQKSSSIKKMGNLYETQVDRFLIDVFELTKTGFEMDTTARAEMEEQIYQCFVSDFATWAKWTKKHKGEKPFVLKFTGAKGYEKETTEYLKQFKKIQDEFVDLRLQWTNEELPKVITKERLQEYITPVADKFNARTAILLTKLKSTYKAKKK